MLDKSKKYCQMAEEMRNNDGYYTEVMNKFILLDMMGYTVNPDSISDVRIHDHVLHSDSMTYDYKNLPTEKDRK